MRTAIEPLERSPPADANARGRLHDRRKHHGKERGNVKQNQQAPLDPRNIESQDQDEKEYDVAANGVLALRGLIHTGRSLQTQFKDYVRDCGNGG